MLKFLIKRLSVILLLVSFTTIFAQNQILTTGKKTNIMNETVLLLQQEQKTTIRFELNELELMEVVTEYGNAYIATSSKAPLMLEKGSPEMIFMTSTFIIPDRGSSELEISYGEYLDFENIEIAPSKGHLPRSIDPSTVPFEKGDIYLKDNFYPSNLATLREPFIMRDVRGQSVDVFPVQYNPVTKVLRVYSEITVTVVNNPKVAGINEFTNQKRHKTIEPQFNEMYKNFFINHAGVIQQRGYPTGEEGELLIICHTPWVNDMKPYVDWKRSIGRKTTIVPTSTTGTSSAAIKTYITNYYNNPDNDLAFVLLVGDHPQLPPHQVGSTRSDVEYAKLVGGDNYLEILIGRFSAQNVAQLQTQIERTINYERDLTTADNWLTTGIGVARNESGYGPNHPNGHDGQENDYRHMDNIRTRLMAYGYTTVYQDYDGGCPGIPNTTAAQINQHINGGASVLNYCNHGSPTGWSVASYSTTHVNQLQNANMLPFLFLVACNNGEFGPWQYNSSDAPCLAEVFMQHTYNNQPAGAIAVFGATISIAWTETMTAQDEFVNITLDLPSPYSGTQPGTKRTIAGAMLNASQKMLLVHGSGCTADYNSWLVFGDPTLMFRTKTPTEMDISHLPVLFLGMSSLSVSCDTDGATATVSYIDEDDEVIIVGTAVVTGGTAEIDFGGPITTPMDLTLTVTGFNKVTHIATIQAIPAAGPYVVYQSYSVVNEDVLTYISDNSEIAVTLKNVGIDETAGALTVEITCADSQITINNATAQCGAIDADETAVVNFTVTIDNDIVDKKTFPVVVTVTDIDNEVWETNMTLTAYAPAFSLEKVLINGVEGGNLEAGEIVTITAVIENKGGADAYNVVGDLGINSPYVTFACDEVGGTSQDMPTGESLNFDFVVITDSNMPFGHEASLAALLTANYGITYSEVFTASNTGSSSYCIPTSSNGCNLNDKFTLVKLTKVSDGTILINHDPGCNSAPNGYIDYTNIVVPIEPGEQYLLNVTVGNGGTQQIKGWFDLNANNSFDTSEMLFSGSCSSGGSTSYTFTAPQDFTPGSTRFRLRCQYSSVPTDACSSMTYGHTLDYTIVLPELYPRPENVVAQLIGANITINWDEPESEDYTPIGYDIYRLNTQLNTTLLTETTFTDEGITEGVYAYNVVAVYAGNKESFAQMSNVICFSVPCERPIEVSGTINEEVNVHITWDDSENYEGELLGYNIYRNDIKLNEELLDTQEYFDYGLIGGTYIYKVSSSYDHCIESAPSDGLTIIIAAQFCETPLNLEVTAAQYSNTAVLTWDAPEIIDGTLVGYNVYRNDAKIIERAPTDRFYNDENLENGTYIYKVSAIYEHCEESGTTEEELITIFVPLYCETVADFTANVIPYTNAAKLNWNEPENFDMPILNYRVFKDGTVYGTLPSTIFEVLVTGLTDGTHYFEVNVIYDHCTSEKTELIEVEVYVPQLCDAPEDFSVEVEENENDAYISWTEPEEIDGDLFGYNIYRDGVVINEDLIEELEYIDLDLPNGTYTYKVSAVYGHCEAELEGDGILVEIDVLGISREVTNSFTMYPNPTNGSVTITGDQLTRIEIYDVQGRKYAEYTNIKGILQIDDLKKYDSGIYLVKMYSETNQATIQRLTIIK